jgi:hypothetical protein
MFQQKCSDFESQYKITAFLLNMCISPKRQHFLFSQQFYTELHIVELL